MIDRARRLVFPLGFVIAAGFAPASAQTQPDDPAQREEQSLEGFGVENSACVEWNDGCATCRRDAGGVAHCSTPGIACQPVGIVCKSRTP
jgi:hypothetical protein